MSTSVIEPGTRLAGRYRLDDRVSEAGGSTFWKATDEILARPVAVLTFAPGFPRVHDVVTAARAASRLTDPRLTQVFDADDSGERAYVVSEWVTGETLEDLLADGPMEPDRAASFLLEAAEALTAAHNAGLAHLCLTPHNLVWTSGGTVKVTGLGVEAMLSGATSDAPAIEDTQGLGSLLYAAITAHWCGAEGTQLPPAPTGSDGRPLAPGQLRAGIPQHLDAIVCRSLRLAQRGNAEPLNTPAAFTDALAQVPRSPLPFVPLVGSTPPAVVPRPESANHTAGDPAERTVPDAAPRGSRRSHTSQPSHSTRTTPVRHAADRGNGPSRGVLAAIAAVVLLIVVLGAWGLSRLGGDAKPKAAPTSAKHTPAAQKSTGPLKPRLARGFDATPGDHSDTGITRGANNAIDGDPGTSWASQHYADPRYGKYKSGLGLMIDMGHPVKVGKVQVNMPDASQPGTVELRVGDSGDLHMEKTATRAAGGTFTLDAKQASGQYLLLWFTKLPQINGEFRIKVNDVTVSGTS